MKNTRRQFLLGAPALAATAAAKRPPNVLVVLTDDQGYGDFSCHGNPIVKTPNIDRLHAESIRLTDFHVTPMCTPTRSQILTGRDALANGAHRVCSGESFIRPGIPTAGDLFGKAGYRTGQFGKWHLGDSYPHRPQDRGFQETVHHGGWGVGCVGDYWNNDYFDDYYIRNGKTEQFRGYCTDVWFSETMRFMEDCGRRRQPFFTYLALNAPHGPLFVPDKYREPYRAHGLGGASYFGTVANIDENMGRLDAMLRRAGLYENTIVVFMTDNGATAGGKFYNAGMRGTKMSLYDGGHRVPCFIRWPGGGLRPAGDIPALTTCQDLLPTFFDLCGLRAPDARFDGVSLAPLLRTGKQPELEGRNVVVQIGRQPIPEFEPVAKWDSTVMWNRWRLVSGKELYDIAADPEQKNDVAAKHSKVVGRLREHYERWWSRVAPGLAEPVRLSVGAEQEAVTCLTSHDWVAPNTANPSAIRAGVRRNGPWNIQVERAGEYEVALRRWPLEADAPITAGLPPHRAADPSFPGVFPEGKALPIASARLQIASFDRSAKVAAGDKAALFRVRLERGPAQIRTSFRDTAGQELCGAYFTYLRRL